MVNFESPALEDSDTIPIKKSGGALYTNKNTLKVLKELGFNAVTLANNHFRDYGQQGINDTISICHSLNLDYVGGERDIEESRKVLRIEIKQKIISFISVCEEEFLHASNNHGGRNKLIFMKWMGTCILGNILFLIMGGIESTSLINGII